MQQADMYATLDTLKIVEIHHEIPKESQELQEYQEYQGFTCNSLDSECMQPGYCAKRGKCRWTPRTVDGGA